MGKGAPWGVLSWVCWCGLAAVCTVGRLYFHTKSADKRCTITDASPYTCRPGFAEIRKAHKAKEADGSIGDNDNDGNVEGDDDEGDDDVALLSNNAGRFEDKDA